MPQFDSNPAHKAKERRELLIKAANLQTEFAEVFKSFQEDPSNAQEVITKGEELREVQKELGDIAAGRLGPQQVTLRIDYAKDAVAKGRATKAEKTSKSVWPSYKNSRGQTVYKIG